MRNDKWLLSLSCWCVIFTINLAEQTYVFEWWSDGEMGWLVHVCPCAWCGSLRQHSKKCGSWSLTGWPPLLNSIARRHTTTFQTQSSTPRTRGVYGSDQTQTKPMETLSEAQEFIVLCSFFVVRGEWTTYAQRVLMVDSIGTSGDVMTRNHNSIVAIDRHDRFAPRFSRNSANGSYIWPVRCRRANVSINKINLCLSRFRTHIACLKKIRSNATKFGKMQVISLSHGFTCFETSGFYRRPPATVFQFH